MTSNSTLAVWIEDPLTKVFRDAKPGEPQDAIAEVARGEHAVLQIVVRSDPAMTGLSARLTRLGLEGGQDVALGGGSARFVGYVPVDRPIPSPPKNQLRIPPEDYPDPLLETATLDVKAGHAQPVWVTVPIPKDAAPGIYRGQLLISCDAGGSRVEAQQPLAIHVFKTTAGPSRLRVTQWLTMHGKHMKVDPKPGSQEYWDLLRRYARNMAEHRQNAIMISPFLAEFRANGKGELEFDFSTFDRWVSIFTGEGVIGLIEGGHFGGRSGDWVSPFHVDIREIRDGKVVQARVDPGSEAAERFYSRFLPALVDHLRRKGWLPKYVQHLADEPIARNVESYRAISTLVRKHAPELRIVEACHSKDLAGAIQVWVPQLNYYHQDYDYYRGRQALGEEVWFYTCMYPQGEYANRFLEQPLIETRLLHWINFRYGATGYLHWGYNAWSTNNPCSHPSTLPWGGLNYLPAGDAWIVYPGENGPIDSIRFEAMRDGIADFELLSMLRERDPQAAERLAGAHIMGFTQYNTDTKTFRQTRRELLTLLSDTNSGLGK